jgi:hypothetical protein
VSWEVETSTEFDAWFAALDKAIQDSVLAAIAGLEEVGPTLGRPLVDSVAGSRHSNMKELRVRKTIRILFAFNRRQRPVLLIGGDKAGQTKRWYVRAIRDADRLFDDLQ